MIIAQLRIGLAVIAAAALPPLGACANAPALDCNQIAEKAKEISQRETLKILSIVHVRETSRSDAETRCTGDATFAESDPAPVYLRLYEENGNTMVAYQVTPFP